MNRGILTVLFALMLVMIFSPMTATPAHAAYKVFTGPANFSNPAAWGGTLPVAGDTLRINGVCTFDNAAANLAYGSLEVSRSATGSIVWPVGGTNTLSVTTVVKGTFGAGTIDMTNGGTLQVRTSWTSTNTSLIAGTGTVNWNVTGATSTLPAAITTYNNLTITATGRTARLGAATTVNGNLLISAGTLDVYTSNFALNVKGDFTNNATFNPRSGTVTLNGTGAQTISGTTTPTTFSTLTINKASGTATLGVNITMAANLTVTAGTLALSTFTAPRTAAGGVLTVSNGATLKIGGTNTLPANYNTHTFGATSTIEYSGTAQTVSSETYGHLTTSGSGTKTLGGAITAAGTLTIGSGTTLNTSAASSYGVTLNGGFTNSGTFTANASNITIGGTATQSIAGFTTTGIVSMTKTGGTATLTGNVNGGAFTLNGLGGTLSLGAGFTHTFTGAWTRTAGTLLGSSSTLNIGGTTTNTAGTFTPGTSTVIYNGSAQAIATVTYNNLTINQSSGNATLGGAATVNGILTLTSGNLAVTDPYVLDLGASATTVGAGDVTGIVRRTSFVAGTVYTFGSQYTTVIFQNVGTLPTEVSVKISRGSAPAWKPDAVQSYGDMIQSGASGSYATFTTHYRDAELNGNTENKLVTWSYIPYYGMVLELGRSNYNTTDNWVEISGIYVSQMPSSFGQGIGTLADATLPTFTWNGSSNTVWANPDNWTPSGIPSDLSDVVIPDASTTPNDPTLPSGDISVGRLTIDSGGILDAMAGSTLTISGASGAWINNGGTFNAGTGTVVFTNAAATIAGVTDFYNVTINPGAGLQMGSHTTMRIAGTITNNGTWDTTATQHGTVEYNGGSQTVLNPNGATPGYHYLILSGSGTKTMPGTALSIHDDFSMSGTASATAGAAMNITGSFTVGSGASFTTGAYTHTIGGDFSNSGTFTATGSTITLNGSASQAIGGTTATAFNNLTISNTNAAVSANTNFSVGGTLTVDSGAVLNPVAAVGISGAGTLTGNGTVNVTRTAATADFSSQYIISTKTLTNLTVAYVGSAAQTVSALTYGGLKINNANGVTLDGNATVNSTLTLTSGALSIGANTLTLNGAVSTTSGTLTGGASSNIIFGGAGASTTLPAVTLNNLTINRATGINMGGAVTVGGILTLTSGAFVVGANTLTLNGPAIAGTPSNLSTDSSSSLSFGGSSTGVNIPSSVTALNNLTINNANGITLNSSPIISGTLTLTSGTFTVGVNILTLNGPAIAGTPANMFTTSSSSLVFGGSSSGVNIPTSVTALNNLTINNANGVTLNGNSTISGILTLTSGNLAVTDPYVLTMGASATTVGAGDVTGIVRRTSFVAGTAYTFGNQYTTINFQNTGTLPTSVSLKITIGSAPAWKTDAVQRTYAFIRTGGSSSYATVNAHYLDAELNGNTENKLVFWRCLTPFTPGTEVEYGRSNYDTTNNWVTISNIDISLLPTSFGQLAGTLGDSELPSFTWNGSSNTVWANPDNWTPTGIPSDLSDVVIPDASTTPNDPTLPSGDISVGRLTIDSGGILDAMAGSTLTISGASGAWINNGGTFNAGTGTVIFTNAAATIAGVTDFYNVTIDPGAGLLMGGGTTMRIAGTITNNGTWDTTATEHNTVEYSGGDQTVLNPNGSTPGYHYLILSGSGTKTMPGTALSIHDDFSMSGTASATAGAAMNITGSFTVGSGASFTTGAYTHTIGGDFSNSGTFTAIGSTITLNGSAEQTMSGATSFNNLTLNNSSGLTINNDETVTGTLTLTSGNIATDENNVIIASGGTVSRTSGHVLGNMQKYVATGATSVTFEVGEAADYDPVTVTFGNVTVAGNLTAMVTNGEHPDIDSAAINPGKDVNDYWSLTNSGITFDAYSATFTFDPSDVDSGATPADFIVGQYSSGWTYPTVGAKTATSTQATGITSFSDFAVGESKASTSLSVANASGTYGGTVNLSATLTSGGLGLSGKTISFALAGSSVDDDTTDISGVATLNSVSLSGLDPGMYPGNITASFAGDADYLASSGSGNLTVNPVITASAGLNGSISPSGSVSIDYNGNQTFTITPNTGYHVADVMVDSGSVGAVTSYPFTNVTINHTISASFAIDTFTLTYSAGANGSISGNASQTVDYGDSGTEVTAVADTGYHFAQWSDASTDNPRTDTNVTGNITVEASFAINTYTLTYTAGANGSITGNTTQTVDYRGNGTAVTAVPDTGYHFVDWNDLSTDNPRTDTNVTGNITVTASFAIDTFTLTYTAGANGSITGNTTQTVDYGGNGTAVTAVPDTGYHFVDWNDLSTDNPRTDTNVTGNITVTANFAINPSLIYTLTYTAGEHGSISGTSPQTVSYGGSGTAVTAVPDTGHHFLKWSDNSTANPRRDTSVTANISVTASFAINTYTLSYWAGAHGYISGINPQTVGYGEDGTAVTAVPETGYHFIKWSDGSTDNPRTDTNVTANIGVTAFFAMTLTPTPTPTPTPEPTPTPTPTPEPTPTPTPTAEPTPTPTPAPTPSTIVTGITREVTGDILPGVSITLDGTGPVVSDQNGYYEILATSTGSHTIVAHKDGFRDSTQTVNIAGLGQEFTVTCNFQGQYGLIPNAPDMWYALYCVNLWLYPPDPDTGLDMWTALDVVNAWLYPIQ